MAEAVKVKLDGMPQWSAEISEISVGAYRTTARGPHGATVDLVGSDPDQLVAELTRAARRLERALGKRGPA